MKSDDFDHDLSDLAPDCPDFEVNPALLELLVDILSTKFGSAVETCRN